MKFVFTHIKHYSYANRIHEKMNVTQSNIDHPAYFHHSNDYI